MSMLQNVPLFVAVVFGLTSLLTLFGLFFILKSSDNSSIKKRASYVLLALLLWLSLQAFLSWKGVYSKNLDFFPPRIFLFGILPMLLLIVGLFLTRSGRNLMDSLSLNQLTLLHTIRIPVELVLFWLVAEKVIPELMTFEGRNFDILSGLTAPVIYILCLRKVRNVLLLIWNVLCLILLLNIVIHAFLAVPTPVQQLAFDQPNIGVLYFPFSWLPTFVVPVVLFCHLVSLRKLVLGK